MNAHAHGAPGAVSVSQSPPLTLPIRHMLLGVLGFALFAVDLLAQSLSLGRGDALSPVVVALTHVLTLGSLLSFAMGAVYQLTTVAFLVPLASVWAARWNFWLYAAGVAGLTGSMAAWWTLGLTVFGTLTAVALYAYAGVVLATLARTQVRGPMRGFVLSAHVHLILAVTVAWAMILAVTGRGGPGLARWAMPLLGTHILLAVVGFFTFLVVGFSYKLLPMFTLSHGFSIRRQPWTLALSHTGLWLAVVGLWWGGPGGDGAGASAAARPFAWAVPWAGPQILDAIGALLGVAAFVNHLLDIRGILRKRMRKKVEPPIQAAIAAAAAGLLGALLAVLGFVWPRGVGAWESAVTVYLLGLITGTVMSYGYKIVPFLVWTKRYSKQAGRDSTLRIADLLNPERARPVLAGFGSGVILLAIGTELGSWVVTVLGALLVAAAVAVFVAEVIRVVDLRQAGREWSARRGKGGDGW
ncbi:MAG: hypothetical protein IRZ33_07120 [Alicyclobacillaceae bacterium]|nr:hypothetical protein [Alicyclobacillaceae bacterium]